MIPTTTVEIYCCVLLRLPTVCSSLFMPFRDVVFRGKNVQRVYSKCTSRGVGRLSLYEEIRRLQVVAGKMLFWHIVCYTDLQDTVFHGFIVQLREPLGAKPEST